MRLEFTEHAVERYIQHHARKLGRTEARRLLEENAVSAVKLKEKTILGDTQWCIEALGILCVTKPDNGTNVCVTVLPNRDPRVWMTEHERELLEERLADTHRKQEETRKAFQLAQDEGARLVSIPKAGLANKGEKVQEAQQRASQLSKMHALLEWESRIQTAELKALQLSLHHDRDKIVLRRALRVALRFIYSQGLETAEPTLRRIAEIDSGLVTPEFLSSKDPS